MSGAMATFPAFDLTDFDLTRLDPRRFGAGRAAELARDGVYVGLGLAILGVQDLQVRRRQLAKAIERAAAPR